MSEVTFSIPDHISQEDAQAVISAFMAAQQTSSAAPVQEQEQPTADTVTVGGGEVVSDHGPIVIVSGTDEDSAPVPYEDDEQDNAVTTADREERSYASTPSGGAIPTVGMIVKAREGGLLGSMAVQREEQERSHIEESISAYGDAARAAANDPDRKRPPRVDPDLLDAAVRTVVRLQHERTRRYIVGEGDNGGMDHKWNPAAEYGFGERERVSDSEQALIGFTIANTRKWVPYSMCHNFRHTGWGIIELIEHEYNATLTKAQVRSSLKRLTDSGFLTEDGSCGKSSRYRLTDISEYLYTKQNDDA